MAYGLGRSVVLMGVAARLSAVHVVVLTNYGLDEYVLDALRAGAAGFLLKDTNLADLLHAIGVAARGDALLSPGITRRLSDLTPTTTEENTMGSTASSTYEGFTAEERAAMKDHAKELKTTARRSAADRAVEAVQDVLAKIAEMQDSDRILAERVHAIITAGAPALAPKLWYGMPAYILDGRIICHFQSAEKFKARYATLGFSDQAQLDEGAIWPTSFALTQVTAEVEARIIALVKQATS